MFFTLVLITTAILLFAIWTYRAQYSYRNMPPGPRVLPIFGSLLGLFNLHRQAKLSDLMHFKAFEYFHSGHKKYGPIYSFGIGKFEAVIIGSYEIFKEVENMDEFSQKLSNELTTPRSMGQEYGLVFTATPEIWVEMRKFSQRTLRDFGFGKRLSMQSVIELEITDLVQEFKEQIKTTNGVLTIRTIFILSVLNVLWCMIAGHRYEHDDPKLLKMIKNNFAMTKAQTFVEPVLLAFPFLKHWVPKLFKLDVHQRVFEESHVYSKSLIEERRQQGLYLGEPQNYIDCFLKKIEENKNDPKSVYSENHLMMMIEDFMQTGSTTTNGTLNYALLFLMLNPEIQRRCQNEIDAIVPRHLVPTMDDIEKMPYFQATILETHRLGNVVPIPIPRATPSDWKYKGYNIPKGTIILSNHYSVQMDADYWKDPENFRPERYINDKGEFVVDKHVVHFGFGKRYCIGVKLVNSVIPIYIATLLQNFNFTCVPGSDPPIVEAELGVSLSPKEFSVHLTPRP